MHPTCMWIINPWWRRPLRSFSPAIKQHMVHAAYNENVQTTFPVFKTYPLNIRSFCSFRPWIITWISCEGNHHSDQGKNKIASQRWSGHCNQQVCKSYLKKLKKEKGKSKTKTQITHNQMSLPENWKSMAASDCRLTNLLPNWIPEAGPDAA